MIIYSSENKETFIFMYFVKFVSYLLSPAEGLIHPHRSKATAARTVSLFENPWQTLYIKARRRFSVFSAYSSLFSLNGGVDVFLVQKPVSSLWDE